MIFWNIHLIEDRYMYLFSFFVCYIDAYSSLIYFAVKFSSLSPAQISLKPMQFEVVHQEEAPVFIGRDWFYKALELELCRPTEVSRGVAVIGPTGCGKTAILEQIMEHSCHGDGSGGIIQNTGECLFIL